MGEDDGNLNSSNLINTSTDSTGNYSSEFNGFAELISPKSMKAECQTECAFAPSENYASYTDISYNTKPCSRLSTDINDTYVKGESETDMNNDHFEKSTNENLPQHLPHTEIVKQDVHNVGLIDKPNYGKINHEPVNFHQQSALADYQKCKFVQNVSGYQPLISTNTPNISPLRVQKDFENMEKVNGSKGPAKTEKLTSSLRLYRKPNFRQLPAIKTKKMSIRLDRSVVDDFISSQRKKKVRLLQPVVVLKRLEDEEDDNSVKRSKAGKRKQNRAIWDGETVKDKKTFKRRRDDMDDAEGSSGFTGGSSGSCYSSDSQNGTSSTRETVDSPPPKSTNGGANDSTEHTCNLVSCKHRYLFIYFKKKTNKQTNETIYEQLARIRMDRRDLSLIIEFRFTFLFVGLLNVFPHQLFHRFTSNYC